MARPALETLQNFRTVEDDQQYARLADLFADDAVYYDPFFGPQRGRDEIRAFMVHMEEVVPGSGARFANWHIEAEVDTGWADWDLEAPDASGTVVSVPGQSLYRLRDGEVIFVADYLDTKAYRRLRGDERRPDHATSLGLSASPDHPTGRAHEVMSRYWELSGAGRTVELASLFSADAQFISPLRGTFTGHAEIVGMMNEIAVEFPQLGSMCTLVDMAGDDRVGWTQWWLTVEGGDVPCWTLFTCRDGEITFMRDVIDFAELRRLSPRG